jgi:hypothetical protein
MCADAASNDEVVLHIILRLVAQQCVAAAI